jgi:hypothetical protein
MDKPEHVTPDEGRAVSSPPSQTWSVAASTKLPLTFGRHTRLIVRYFIERHAGRIEAAAPVDQGRDPEV